VALCEARLTDPAGKLLAHGTGTCLILAREGTPRAAARPSVP
jgi:acyl-coenzyme A thioesterase PaaI-like protein